MPQNGGRGEKPSLLNLNQIGYAYRLDLLFTLRNIPYSWVHDCHKADLLLKDLGVAGPGGRIADTQYRGPCGDLFAFDRDFPSRYSGGPSRLAIYKRIDR